MTLLQSLPRFLVKGRNEKLNVNGTGGGLSDVTRSHVAVTSDVIQMQWNAFLRYVGIDTEVARRGPFDSMLSYLSRSAAWIEPCIRTEYLSIFNPIL